MTASTALVRPGPSLDGEPAAPAAVRQGSTRLIAFLAGFQPEENVESKTTEQALMAANVKPEILDRAWKIWLRTGK